ncbi:hypothetical protein Lalb_Chr05g0226811 [Lupinus albus]|uniref:Uncharacterized protein n=1 Tax=Lupinus albus TaxID=3870 RepID=A0A6A4QMT7_LUPAL|nr:hypothetical protein Lalb_Chr05g0226811 [Lupinus albus]
MWVSHPFYLPTSSFFSTKGVKTPISLILLSPFFFLFILSQTKGRIKLLYKIFYDIYC